MDIKKDTVYWCKTKELSDKFLQECKSHAYNCGNAKDFSDSPDFQGEIDFYDIYKEGTCYIIGDYDDSITFSDKGFFEGQDYKIVEYKMEMDDVRDSIINIIKTEIASTSIDNTIYTNIADKLVSNLPNLLASTNWTNLPCKIGDTIYGISTHNIYKPTKVIKQYTVSSILITDDDILVHSENISNGNELQGYVNDTIFLTQAKAEAKLAEIKEK